MIVISDSNIIFSALYSNKGIIASILRNEHHLQFIAPSFVLEEIQEHLPEIMEDLGKSKNEIINMLNELFYNIKFYEITIEIPKKIKMKAVELAKDIDIDDAPFIALHFHTGHKIWTEDKVLKEGLLRRGYDICISTDELKKYLYKK